MPSSFFLESELTNSSAISFLANIIDQLKFHPFIAPYLDIQRNIHPFVHQYETLALLSIRRPIRILIADEIGPSAFKTTRSVNKSMSDAIMVAIAQILNANKKPVDLKNNHQKLIGDDNFKKYTQSGTSTQGNVKGRIDIARNYFLGLK